MDPSSSRKIRFTTQYCSKPLDTLPLEQPTRIISRHEHHFKTQPSRSDDESPVIEIVTVIHAADPRLAVQPVQEPLETYSGAQLTHMPGRYLIIRSAALSQTIRDVIKFYPGQILTGSNLVIQEPFACLMHHIASLEDVFKSQDSSKNTDHLGLLLEFLRPRFEHHYLAARNRLSHPQPTIGFDDIWTLMIPGSLAYTQVHWPSDQVGCAISTVFIDQFDGEMLVTALPIYPSTVLDATDAGDMRQRCINRGTKVRDIVWGSSKYMCYNGKCFDRSRQQFTGRILIGGTSGREESSLEHDWNFDWISRANVMQPKQETSSSQTQEMLDPKHHSHNILDEDQLFILSPCLSAFRLSKKDWILINVQHILPLDLPEHIPRPVIPEESLTTVMSLVSSHDYKRSPDTANRKGVSVLLHGETGVGKSYTIDYIANETRRPLLTLDINDIATYPNGAERYLARWFTIGEKWNAIFLIDNIDYLAAELPHPANIDDKVKVAGFIQAMKNSRGIMFLTTNRLECVSQAFLPLIELKISLPRLDEMARAVLWEALEERFCRNYTLYRLSRSAKEFLQSPEPTQVEWTAHEMTHCFRMARALASADAQQSAQDEEIIHIEIDHFKGIMNSIHDYGQYLDEISGGPTEEREIMRPNHLLDNSSIYNEPPAHNMTQDGGSDSSTVYGPRMNPRMAMNWQDDRFIQSQAEELGTSPSSIFTEWIGPSNGYREPVKLRSDSALCIPSLNGVEWEAFQAAGNKRNMFRTANFYAIDLLVGDPQITLQTTKKARRGPKTSVRNTEFKRSKTLDSKRQDKHQHDHLQGAGNPVVITLPERIRINSRAIVQAFSEIHNERFPTSFLMFAPYPSLLYYELDFRDWVMKKEITVEDRPSDDPQKKLDGTNTNDENERDIARAAVEEMKCLLSFIDDYVKRRQKYLADTLCKTVTFSDLALLFNPGDTVVGPDQKQAYRIIKLTRARHRVKGPNEDGSMFWKDASKAEFADNPICIYGVHVDFDGDTVGPVSSIFAIHRFDGLKDVTSLPVYPLRFAKDTDLREKLIARGKTFMEVAHIRHMHYTGLTLGPRESIDSPVVIDFHESISRYPEWKPTIQHATDDPKLKEVAFLDDDRHSSQRDARRTYLAVERSSTLCIEECCGGEAAHHEEYVEDRRREEYITSQLGSDALGSPPPSIIPGALEDLKQAHLADDEYLIMSHRVLGFALRSRKWYELDMTNLSEAIVLGKGDGFEQLVLPDGHGELVKSMIKQHFRDRKMASGNAVSTDIVRGKGGRGLIMLLHGVPGVGKTSTAECVADLFRRPLFQITSGDLGTTAKEVEDTLDDNFNLASRWDSILLIDEADVFLGQRTREDFVRNSLVAVFLRMMEYYSGVLFLTTNRVGVFDEAFSSRIHISLYYPPLDKKSTLSIFEKNWERIQARYNENGRTIDIKVSEIKKFAREYFDKNEEGRWNGRQIRNAFQSALALAELDACPTDDPMADLDHTYPVVLGSRSFETVAQIYENFLAYLKQVYGANFGRRARENLWRFDGFGVPKMPNALTTRLVPPDLAPPARGHEPQSASQAHSQYTSREPQRAYHAPQNYPEHYAYRDEGRWHPPPPEQHHYGEASRGYASESHPVPPMRPEFRGEAFNEPRAFSSPGAHTQWFGQSGREATPRVHQSPTPHGQGSGYSTRDHPAGGHSPFPRTD